MTETTVDSGNQSEDKNKPTPVIPSVDGAANESQENLANSLPTGKALADMVAQDPVASEILRRQSQSDKDKGVQKALAQSSDAMKLAISIAKSKGIELTDSDIEEAGQKAFISELMKPADQTQDPEIPASNSAPQGGVILAQDAANRANQMLGANVPKEVREKVLSVVSSGVYMDEASLQQAVSAALYAESQVPTPNEASVQRGQQNSGSGDGEPDQAALQSEFDTKKAALGTPPNADGLHTLRMEYRAKGLKD